MVVFGRLDETKAVLQYGNVALLVCLSATVQYDDSNGQVGFVTLQFRNVKLDLREKDVKIFTVNLTFCVYSPNKNFSQV